MIKNIIRLVWVVIVLSILAILFFGIEYCKAIPVEYRGVVSLIISLLSTGLACIGLIVHICLSNEEEE